MHTVVCACVSVRVCVYTAFCLSPNSSGFQGGRAALWCSEVVRFAPLTLPIIIRLACPCYYHDHRSASPCFKNKL